MVSPDGHVRYARDLDARFVRELGAGTIFIETRHGKPAIVWNFFGVVHRDQAICVAWISDHKHAHIGRGVLLNGLALADENPAVDPEQIFAFHSGFARHAANEQSPVHIAESFIEIGCRHD